MMTLLEAIDARHSVRRYISKRLEQDVVDALQAKIDQCNREGRLHIQLVLDEKKGFSGLFAYGAFSGVENYIVMAGEKANDLDERVGYYGEQIVLLAQQLGLGTCWAGLSYRKVKGTFNLADGEKVACMISLGYPDDPGRKLKRKTVNDVSNARMVRGRRARRAQGPNGRQPAEVLLRVCRHARRHAFGKGKAPLLGRGIH